MKRCGRCRITKPVSEFSRSALSMNGTSCRSCNSEYLNRWRKNNPEKFKAQNSRRNALKKRAVIYSLGDKCSCCGESRFEFLQIDHINNDGAAHRRSLIPKGTRPERRSSAAIYNLYKQILSGNTDGLQILCANCNWGKARNGGVCPHEDERVAAALLVA